MGTSRFLVADPVSLPMVGRAAGSGRVAPPVRRRLIDPYCAQDCKFLSQGRTVSARRLRTTAASVSSAKRAMAAGCSRRMPLGTSG